MVDGSFDAAVAGCTHVFHTATPFTSKLRPGQCAEALQRPALDGLRNVLSAVERAGSVRRVVLTSSVAAVLSTFLDHPDGAAHVYGPGDWNETDRISHGGFAAYSAAKAMQEREAWRLAEGKPWDLVTINPCLGERDRRALPRGPTPAPPRPRPTPAPAPPRVPAVVGPSVTRRQDSETIEILQQLLGGGSPAAPPLLLATVDVRNVAAAHSIAAFDPACSGRYICANDSIPMVDQTRAVKKAFPHSRAPTRELPRWCAPPPPPGPRPRPRRPLPRHRGPGPPPPRRLLAILGPLMFGMPRSFLRGYSTALGVGRFDRSRINADMGAESWWIGRDRSLGDHLTWMARNGWVADGAVAPAEASG